MNLDLHQRVRDVLSTVTLGRGLGTVDRPCTVQLLNQIMRDSLRPTDMTPPTVSPILTRWIVVVQDALSDERRNCQEWRELVPLVLGTNDGRDRERLVTWRRWLERFGPVPQQLWAAFHQTDYSLAHMSESGKVMPSILNLVSYTQSLLGELAEQGCKAADVNPYNTFYELIRAERQGVRATMVVPDPYSPTGSKVVQCEPAPGNGGDASSTQSVGAPGFNGAY